MNIATALRAGRAARYGFERLSKKAIQSNRGYKSQEITKRFPPTLVLNPPAARLSANQTGRRTHHKLSNNLTRLPRGGGPIGSNISAINYANRMSAATLAVNSPARQGTRPDGTRSNSGFQILTFWKTHRPRTYFVRIGQTSNQYENPIAPSMSRSESQFNIFSSNWFGSSLQERLPQASQYPSSPFVTDPHS